MSTITLNIKSIEVRRRIDDFLKTIDPSDIEIIESDEWEDAEDLKEYHRIKEAETEYLSEEEALKYLAAS